MNSNKKVKLERAKTPVQLNKSEYVFKSSASKRFSPNLSRRTNLNETVGLRQGPSSDPKFKTKLSTNYEINYESEYDAAYNDYLQALMKKQFVERKVKEHEQVLEGQLMMQNENIHKRLVNLNEIVADSESFRSKSESLQMIKFLEKSFTSFSDIYEKYAIRTQMNTFIEILNLECDNVILKNIKPLQTQEEYDKFMQTVESCLCITQKIINSGRNFNDVHNLAENIRVLFDLIDSIQKSRQVISKLNEEALYTFLQNMSDLFAKKYNE